MFFIRYIMLNILYRTAETEISRKVRVHRAAWGGVRGGWEKSGSRKPPY